MFPAAISRRVTVSPVIEELPMQYSTVSIVDARQQSDLQGIHARECGCSHSKLGLEMTIRAQQKLHGNMGPVTRAPVYKILGSLFREFKRGLRPRFNQVIVRIPTPVRTGVRIARWPLLVGESHQTKTINKFCCDVDLVNVTTKFVYLFCIFLNMQFPISTH